MIYIFGGEGKTGCSAIAREFHKEINTNGDVGYAYGGQIMRDATLAAGFTRIDPLNQTQLKPDIPAFREHCSRTGRDIDEEIETILLTRMAETLRNRSSLIVESKTMAPYMLTEACGNLLARVAPGVTVADLAGYSRAAWIHADVPTRARRSLGLPDGTPDNPQILAESEQICLRQSKDGNDYRSKYRIAYPSPGEVPGPSFGQVYMNGRGVTLQYTLGKVREQMLAPVVLTAR